MGQGGGAPLRAAQLREVVERKSVTAAIMKARELYPRGEDAWDAISFAISHDPHGAGVRIENSDAYVAELPGAPSIGLPKVTALYEPTKNQVAVAAVRFQHDGVIVHSAMFDTEIA